MLGRCNAVSDDYDSRRSIIARGVVGASATRASNTQRRAVFCIVPYNRERNGELHAATRRFPTRIQTLVVRAVCARHGFRDNALDCERTVRMQALEIVVALMLAVIVFVVAKLIGLVIHIALIAAILGLIAGFIIARALRRS